MIFSKTIAISATPTPLSTYIGSIINIGKYPVILQAPTGNGAVINFGNEADQSGFISAGSSVSLGNISAKNTYVKGTPADTLIIMVP